MNWRKAPESIKEAFDAALPDDAAVQRRQMFGYPAAFVNGNMFAGVHQDDIVVRLPEERRQTLTASQGLRQFEPMPGRPMREYLVVPPREVEDGEALASWLAEAFRYVAALPGKTPKPRAKQG